MRALRTRQYQYIANLAAPLPFPIAGDIASSATWHAIEAQPSLGLGARSVDAFLHRPAEELYDSSKDPHLSSVVGQDQGAKAEVDGVPPIEGAAIAQLQRPDR